MCVCVIVWYVSLWCACGRNNFEKLMLQFKIMFILSITDIIIIAEYIAAADSQ